MDGIINIYKPKGMTSFACVSKVRRALGEKKAGHAGTLDPEAAGVLPVCVGKATKCVDCFLEMPKKYRGEVTFGLNTQSCDIWGEVVDSLDKDDERLKNLSLEKVIEAANTFLGETDQIPPVYAAIKIGGVPAYKLARQGKNIEMKSRKITVYEIDVIDFIQEDGEYPKAVIDVKCSRGTYIRSIFRDLGEKLGVYGCMSALIRTEYGFLNADSGILPDEIGKDKKLPFYATDYIYKDLPKIILNKKEENKYRTGQKFSVENFDTRISKKYSENDIVRVYTDSGVFLSTAIVKVMDNNSVLLKTDKFFDCNEVACFE